MTEPFNFSSHSKGKFTKKQKLQRRLLQPDPERLLDIPKSLKAPVARQDIRLPGFHQSLLVRLAASKNAIEIARVLKRYTWKGIPRDQQIIMLAKLCVSVESEVLVQMPLLLRVSRAILKSINNKCAARRIKKREMGRDEVLDALIKRIPQLKSFPEIFVVMAKGKMTHVDMLPHLSLSEAKKLRAEDVKQEPNFYQVSFWRARHPNMMYQDYVMRRKLKLKSKNDLEDFVARNPKIKSDFCEGYNFMFGQAFEKSGEDVRAVSRKVFLKLMADIEWNPGPDVNMPVQCNLWASPSRIVTRFYEGPRTEPARDEAHPGATIVADEHINSQVMQCLASCLSDIKVRARVITNGQVFRVAVWAANSGMREEIRRVACGLRSNITSVMRALETIEPNPGPEDPMPSRIYDAPIIRPQTPNGTNEPIEGQQQDGMEMRRPNPQDDDPVPPGFEQLGALLAPGVVMRVERMPDMQPPPEAIRNRRYVTGAPAQRGGRGRGSAPHRGRGRGRAAARPPDALEARDDESVATEPRRNVRAQGRRGRGRGGPGAEDRVINALRGQIEDARADIDAAREVRITAMEDAADAVRAAAAVPAQPPANDPEPSFNPSTNVGQGNTILTWCSTPDSHRNVVNVVDDHKLISKLKYWAPGVKIAAALLAACVAVSPTKTGCAIRVAAAGLTVGLLSTMKQNVQMNEHRVVLTPLPNGLPAEDRRPYSQRGVVVRAQTEYHNMTWDTRQVNETCIAPLWRLFSGERHERRPMIVEMRTIREAMPRDTGSPAIFEIARERIARTFCVNVSTQDPTQWVSSSLAAEAILCDARSRSAHLQNFQGPASGTHQS